MTRQRKHTMSGPEAFTMRRGVLIFAVTALLLIALGLAARAALTSNDTPDGQTVGANSASGIDGAAGGAADEGGVVLGPPRPSATPVPRVSPVTAPPGVITKELATTTVTGFVASVAAIDPVSNVTDQLSTVARGAVLAEVGNQAQELQANGWSLRGKPVVKSVVLVSSNLTAAPPTAIVQACVDSSSVMTVDVDGKRVGGPTASSAALNVFSMQQDAGIWRVVSRTFPNDPAC